MLIAILLLNLVTLALVVLGLWWLVPIRLESQRAVALRTLASAIKQHGAGREDLKARLALRLARKQAAAGGH